MLSILTRRHTSSHSWTGVRVHRMMRRGIMSARWTAKLLVDVIGRACCAGTLWAVRRWHSGPIHVAHMGRATKLTHWARRRLLGVAVRLWGRCDSWRLILWRKSLLSGKRGATDQARCEWLSWRTRRWRRARYAVGLGGRVCRGIRRRSSEGWRLPSRTDPVDLSVW
jgi:hypothetical protein